MEEDKKTENKFQVELMRRMDRVIVKLEDLENDVSGIKKGVANLEREVSKNGQKLDVLTGQFTDVVGMVLEDNKRITKIEKDVEDLESNIH